MFLWLTPVVVAVLLSVVSILSRREQEAAHSNEVFTMSRSLIISALAVALICFCMAGGLYFYGDSRPKSDALVPLVIAGASILCALVWSTYVVRLCDSGLRVGLFGMRAVSYTSVARIVEIRNQGSPRALLVTHEGGRVGIWSNLVGFDALVQKLLTACPNATHDRLDRPGQKIS